MNFYPELFRIFMWIRREKNVTVIKILDLCTKISSFPWVDFIQFIGVNANKPNIAVLLQCLDKILDYLPLEDLSRMAWVSKFFWYAATLERLYEKFGFDQTESFIESSLGDLVSNYERFLIILHLNPCYLNKE